MRARRRDEAGDTLVEIVIALVLIGIIAGGFFTAITTSTAASRSQRDLVTADAVLRDYAETAKQAVRDTCTTGNAGTAVTVSFPPPNGFSVSGTVTCPSASGVNMVHISVSTPVHFTKVLDIDVRLK